MFGKRILPSDTGTKRCWKSIPHRLSLSLSKSPGDDGSSQMEVVRDTLSESDPRAYFANWCPATGGGHFLRQEFGENQATIRGQTRSCRSRPSRQDDIRPGSIRFEEATGRLARSKVGERQEEMVPVANRRVAAWAFDGRLF